MKLKYILIGLMLIVTLVTIGNADENRFYTQSEERLASGYNVIVVEDTVTDNLLYFTTYEDNTDFDFNVVRTNYDSIESIDSDKRFYTESEERLPSGFNIIVVRDTMTNSIVYYVSYEDYGEFKSKIIPDSKVQMW